MRFLGDEVKYCKRWLNNINDCFSVSKRSKVVLENKIIQRPVETSFESPHYPNKK